MTLPPPPGRHRLEAAIGRYRFQLQRTHRYIDAVLPAIKDQAESDPNLQYCFQTLALMLHTFMEGHYRLLLSLATLYQPDEVRAYLARKYPDEAERFEEMPAFRLMQETRREVSFRKKGRRLKSIFALLFSVGPFADADAEAKCLDLIEIRNVITHQEGFLEDSNLPNLRSPDVVVHKEAIGSTVFHELRIQPVFLTDALFAFGRSVDAIDVSLKQDPRYKF